MPAQAVFQCKRKLEVDRQPWLHSAQRCQFQGFLGNIGQKTGFTWLEHGQAHT